MQQLIAEITQGQLKTDLPSFRLWRHFTCTRKSS